MRHLSEEELVLLYYGEHANGAGEHLQTCEFCRTSFEALARLLHVMDDLETPVRPEAYSSRLWNRIAPQIERSPTSRFSGVAKWFEPRRLGAVAAMAVLVVAAFLAGRISERRQKVAGLSGPVRERIMLVAVGEHLERSQMILVELMNNESKGPLDISEEQQFAEDLIGENRLYRQAALKSGDTGVSNVLDELERVLLEIAHGPAKLDSAELEQFRRRIEAEGILFKIRVLGSNLKNREQAPSPGGRKL